ncbi:MAG: IclR family transcriptional regulator [Litoreibacter sp.]|nr:IclR family transcriptional regulator [Litoreibacter sp.]MCY4336125.1 IclR family transcriptional regulator [Litoreibacter sp.]
MSERSNEAGTVGKALNVLDQVAAFDRPVKFSELLESSEYPKATLYRLLKTLLQQGMIAHDDSSGAYTLGVRLVRLAHQAWRTSSLAPVARPYIDALSLEIGETVHLAQLDHAQVLYVDKRNAAVPIEMYSQAGKVGPVYCTGVGKAMLAWSPVPEQTRIIEQQSYHRFTDNTLTSRKALRSELEIICSRGHAFDNEEHEPGIICVALPILSQSGQVLGGLSVTSTTARHTLESLAQLVPHMKTAVGRIAEDAESWRFPEQIRERA